MASLTHAMNGSPPEPGPMGRIIGDADPFAGLSPVDALKLSMELRNKQRVSPEQATANQRQNLRDLLSVIPGPGNVIAAEDAVTQGGEAASAFGEGRYGPAALHGGLSALSAFGAVTGLPTGRLAGNAARGASSTAPAFPAWHGSPHDFDEFKLDKIGTGEGAQAYGHGLYFAESEGVAKHYQNVLGRQASPFSRTELAEIKQAVDWLKNGRQGDADATVAEWVRVAKGDLASDYIDGPFLNPTDAQLADHLSGTLAPRGRLYHTEIDAEPHQLLDWDKPLSEQGDVGQKALSVFERMGFTADPGRTLGDIKQIANERYGRGSFKEAEVSNALREAGIPGIRYLDQGSRGAGEGSRNFVIFDDKLVKVLGKE